MNRPDGMRPAYGQSRVYPQPAPTQRSQFAQSSYNPSA